MSEPAPQVRDNPARSRYEIVVDGETAGSAYYRLHGDVAEFTHTEISGAFEGRGLGSTLIRAALDDARSRGRQALPQCPFVRDFIAKHGEYVDLVPEHRRAAYGLG
jgi:predicted GNAT family acetyltransferase